VKATAGHLFAFGAIALLSSCQPPDIKISAEKVGGRTLLHLTQDWGFIISDRKAPCVREVGLYEPETYDRDKAAWLIEAGGDVQCLHLGSLVVGEVPKGWNEVARLSAVTGRTYTVSAQGIGSGEINIRY
jgi:hypothetical protein